VPPFKGCQAITLVKRRPRNQASVAGTRCCYAGLVDNKKHLIGSSRTDRTASPSFEELAAQQGVTPIDDFKTLLGVPLPEDESAEEFSQACASGVESEPFLPASNECRHR